MPILLAKFLASPAGRLAGGLLAIGLAFAAGYVSGRQDGRASVVAELTGDRITILKDGKEIDEQAFAADDAVLCALLGGCVPDAGSD